MNKASIEIALAASRLLTRNRFSVISYDITLSGKELYIVFVIKIFRSLEIVIFHIDFYLYKINYSNIFVNP